MMPAEYYDVFRCPTCGEVFRDGAARGGNSIGAVRWSDGWCDAPMRDLPPPIVLCPICAAPIGRRELHCIGRGSYDPALQLELVGELGLPAAPPSWHVAPHVARPTLAGLLIAADLLARDHGGAECETRMWIWWRSNDPYRDVDATWVALSRRPAEQIDSLNRLTTLLDVNERRARLMLAELHRESERFVECRGLLDGFRRGRLLRAATTLRQLAQSGDSRLVYLGGGERNG